MDKYWRLWLLVLVAFLFGTTTVVATPAFKGGTRNPAPTLFTLLDGVDVASGCPSPLCHVNVEGFRDFKVFIRRNWTKWRRKAHCKPTYFLRWHSRH